MSSHPNVPLEGAGTVLVHFTFGNVSMVPTSARLHDRAQKTRTPQVDSFKLDAHDVNISIAEVVSGLVTSGYALTGLHYEAMKVEGHVRYMVRAIFSTDGAHQYDFVRQLDQLLGDYFWQGVRVYVNQLESGQVATFNFVRPQPRYETRDDVRVLLQRKKVVAGKATETRGDWQPQYLFQIKAGVVRIKPGPGLITAEKPTLATARA